jgi:hypothetical protein
VAEWLKAPHSKCGVRVTVSWVRIPPSPPTISLKLQRPLPDELLKIVASGEKQDGHKMENFLDRATALIATASATILIISICHEYGYFFIVGSAFQSFLTFSDYFSNAIFWLPALVIAIYSATNFDVLKRRPVFSKEQWSNWVALAIALAGPFAAFFFAPYDFFAVTCVFTFVFFWAIIFDLLIPPTDSQFASSLRQVVKFGVPICIASMAWGIVHGSVALTHAYDAYILKFEKDNSEELRVVLRSFEKGILVRDAKLDRVEFVKWSDLTELIKIREVPTRDPLSCSFFNWRCSLKPEGPTP